METTAHPETATETASGKRSADTMSCCMGAATEADSEGGEQHEMACCPMAARCSGMMTRFESGSGLWLFAPGLLILLIGVLILVEPQVLVWLAGVTAILMGLATLAMAATFRHFAKGFARFVEGSAGKP